MATSREAAALVPILERFSVPRDGVLVVHSAIAPLSRRGLRAEGIIEALIDYMRDGNLFMPTMTWRTVTPDHPHWDELETPSHSVAGLGPAAPLLLSRHHIDNTPVSANSPYGLMRDYETYTLMIGVGLETVTAIHLPEETVNVDLYVRPAETARLYRCRDRHGTVHQVWARRHWRLDRDFNQFGPPLMAKHQLETGTIENCPYMIVSQRDLLRHVFAALIDNPRATLSAKAQQDASILSR